MPGPALYGPTGPFTRRMLATILAGQSLVVFFGALVARAVADAAGDEGLATTYFWVGTGVAALAVVAAGVQRRPWGVTVGWVVLVLTALSAFVVPMMLVAALIFGALWVTSLVQGPRIEAEQERRRREAEEQGTPEEG